MELVKLKWKLGVVFCQRGIAELVLYHPNAVVCPHAPSTLLWCPLMVFNELITLFTGSSSSRELTSLRLALSLRVVLLLL